MKLLMGVIPAKDRYWLDIVWPVILPGVTEVASLSNGEYSAFNVYQELFSGVSQLYLAYLDHEDTTHDQFQKAWIGKLNNPHQDFVGFAVIQLLPDSFHIFQAYLMPQYRNSEAFSICEQFIEKEARKMQAPYLSLRTNPQVVDVAKLGFEGNQIIYRKKL